MEEGKKVQGKTREEIEEMEEEELGTFIDQLSPEERAEVERMLRLDQEMGIDAIPGVEKKYGEGSGMEEGRRHAA